MTDTDDVRPARPHDPAARATGDEPPTGDTDRGHDQDRGTPGDTGGTVRKAEEEQQRQLAEGRESPG